MLPLTRRSSNAAAGGEGRAAGRAWRFAAAWLAVATLTIGAAPALGADEIDGPPIRYHDAAVDDPVAQLQARIESGEAQLEWHERLGWLPSVLAELGAPRESQLLVFSKTSLQTRKIDPSRPRAIYFNDDSYVGYVQHGEVIELTAVDPVNGPIFYTLDQTDSRAPRIERDTGDCLACHQNHHTRDVPGLVVRSVYPDPRGHALLHLGSEATGLPTPLESRYGGWYVTDDTPFEHRGNKVYAEPDGRSGAAAPLPVGVGPTANPARYLTPHSDPVALMVLEHQAAMHNAITRASYEARRAVAYDTMWRELLDKPADHTFDVSLRRLDRAADELLETLLCCGEQPLPGPVRGGSGFAEVFSRQGPRDEQGRSLRDLDLQTRLFRYPCSYLIYSESFAALPATILERVERRLADVLSGEDASPEFEHLSRADRDAIRSVLRATDAPLRP